LPKLHPPGELFPNKILAACSEHDVGIDGTVRSPAAARRAGF
jgi:hypothetical protein